MKNQPRYSVCNNVEAIISNMEGIHNVQGYHDECEAVI